MRELPIESRGIGTDNAPMNNTQTPPPNPVIRTTLLRAYPGWEIRQYADGGFVAYQNNGTGWCCADTFADAIYYVKNGEPRV